MAISYALHNAQENLLRVIPSPLTAEEEAERVRTGKGHLDVDPAALHDGARRFVDALSADTVARAELNRRGTLCATLTGKESDYSHAAKRAQKVLAGWNLAAQFAQQPVYLDFLGGNVRNLLNAAGEELVADVRGKHENIERLLREDEVPSAIRPPLEAWRDAAWSIISQGENESLDGCYWLLHAENLQYALFVPAAAPEVRQAAESLVRWCEERSKPGSTPTDQEQGEGNGEGTTPQVPPDRKTVSNAGGDGTKARRPQRLKWKTAQCAMLTRLKNHTLPSSIRDAAKAIGKKYSTTRTAVVNSDALKTHFGITGAGNATATGTLLNELTSQTDARTQRELTQLSQDQRESAESELHAMPADKRLELFELLATSPDGGSCGDVQSYGDEEDETDWESDETD